MNYIIRKSNINDSQAIAHLITLAWNETYKGIVNDAFLQSLYTNENERAKNFFQNFDEKSNHQFVLEINHQIVGYIKVAKTDYENLKKCGEIIALYILKDYQNHGFGKKLMNYGLNELKQMCFDKMIVGCLNNNPSNAFYSHMGGKLLGTRDFTKTNDIIKENVYYFKNI